RGEKGGGAEIMLVAGFSGIGKTAVVNEVHKPITRQKGYFIKGKFDQFNRNIPFSAFVQAFRDLMGQLLGESDAQLQEWKEKILEAVGESGQVLIEVIPELERIIGQQPPVPELSGSAAQNRFNLLFEKFIAIFTTVEHPLTLFLDDLQWADSASLNLLKVLMGDSRTRYLLLLGAYRDHEVFPAHPLMLCLGELEKQQTTISTITLAPLSVAHINQLVAETLSCSVELAAPLTDLVYQKTKGNPFFTTQFLKGLHEDEFITFNQNLRYWECDLVKVRDAALTDDVVEFMAGRLHKLPEETQNVLKLAACIGNQFDLETLAIICETPSEEVAAALWSALREGLTLPQSQAYKFFQGGEQNKEEAKDISVSYRFLHDRVQQAAYLLIDDTQKQSVHLTIGKLLLAHQSVIGSDDNIFNILSHLMVGINADPLALSSRKLAKLALSAGMKAKLSIAYQAAIDYFDFGLSRLPANSWIESYQFKLDLSREKAECHYFLGQFEESEKILNKVLLKVKNTLDAARIYSILMTQRGTQGIDYLSGIEAGLKGLAILGMELSTDSETLSSLVEREHQKVRDSFKTVSPTILLELPDMSDPVQQSCMKLLNILWSVTYIAGHSNLNRLTMLRMMNLSLKYGRTESSSFSFCCYGMTLAYQGQYKEAYEFGRVSLDVDQKFNNKHFIAKNTNHFCHAINPYIRPLKENLPLYRQSFEICTELGDLIFGVWAVDFMIWTHIIKGSDLDLIHEEIQKYMSYVQDVNDQNMLHSFEIKQKFIQELMDNSMANEMFTCQGFLDSSLISSWQQKNFDHGINWYGFLVLQRLYLKEDYWGVVRVARFLKPTLPANFGFFPIIIYHTYYPLSLAAIFATLDEKKQAIDWQELEDLQQVLYTWSQHCPENFLHKYQLVSAEIAGINGDSLQAMELYDSAIAGAKENEYIQEEALANELAAKFYLNWGKEKFAVLYMQQAYYCYTQWGAKAKTDDLEKRYSQLLSPILQRQQLSGKANDTIVNLAKGTVANTSAATREMLDLASLMKASRSLSQEIDLEGAIANFMQVIQENAGAETVALMLFRENTLIIEAKLADGKTQPIESIPVEDSLEVPLAIVNTVKHTQTSLILDNGARETDYVRDRYIKENQPRSILCLPLLKRGRFIGIVYLENNQTIGAFTPNRVEVLELLCAQAAITLENARLYQRAQQAIQLERELQELQRTQVALIQSEKMFSLGQMVAGIAHEINNPINFIYGNINHARDYAEDFIRVIDLYQHHFPETNPEIEEIIADIDLEYSQADFHKILESMKSGVERVQKIVQALRNFSRLDEAELKVVDLHEGIESTLTILQSRLEGREGGVEIQVVKDYRNLPRVECYAGQLNQVFMNIINNAIDALESSPEIQPRICLRTQTNGETLTIAISDNGMGIKEEIRDRIFDPFFTTKAVGKGTGLGLSIAYQIITEQHEGSLSCQSQPGETTFFIEIPIQQKKR
ncbi:hypothetical protein AFK68_15205, partial [Hydrocoleum sp. CS-953]